MTKPRGLYVTPDTFVHFADPVPRDRSLSEQIATRDRSPDFFGLGFLLPNPDPILKKQGRDVRVYRELRGDAHVGGCIRRRKAAIKAMEWRVNREKASARATKLCSETLAGLDLDRLLNETTEAVLFGWQPLEVTWRNALPVLPASVVGKPQEWFHFDTDARLRFRSREQPMHGEELPPRKFLVATQEASYANPYGFADLSMCFWPTVFKRGGLKFWVTFVEKFGTPWVVGKQPRNAGKPETDQLLDQLEAMVQDAVAVIPDDSSVDIIEAGGKSASSDLYRELLMFCRSEVSIALLGQNQSTEASSTHASATAGLQVADTIRDGDARLVAATVNQLFRWIVDLFEGEQAPAPTFELYEEEAVNKAQAERDGELCFRGGVRFTPQYWKRTYRLEPGDIVEDPAPAAAGVDPSFAEEEIAKALATGGDQVASEWVDQVAALVRQNLAPQAFEDALLELFGHLPVDQLGEVMALAFELAHLQGRDAARTENGGA